MGLNEQEKIKKCLNKICLRPNKFLLKLGLKNIVIGFVGNWKIFEYILIGTCSAKKNVFVKEKVDSCEEKLEKNK